MIFKTYRFGHIYGAEFHVYPGILAVPIAMILVYDNAAEFASHFAIVLGIFASIFAHEMGHLLTARRFGVRCKRLVMGLVAAHVAIHDDDFEYIPARHSVAISLGGPVANGVLFHVAWLWNVTYGYTEFGHWMADLNFCFFVVNLLPFIPYTDGFNVMVSGLLWKIYGGSSTYAQRKMEREYEELCKKMDELKSKLETA